MLTGPQGEKMSRKLMKFEGEPAISSTKMLTEPPYSVDPLSRRIVPEPKL